CSRACPKQNATRSSAPSTSPGSPPAPRRVTLTGSSPDRPPSTRSPRTIGDEMTVTPSPDTPPSTTMTDEEYGALRAAAALWVGTSVLITDERGRILVQHVDYRTTCLLPGGGVDENEPPAQGAGREVREELGVTTTVDRGLAVDWVSADSLD